MMLLSGLQSLGADLDAYVTGGQASVEKKLIRIQHRFQSPVASDAAVPEQP
jgi:hypothetical protein